jgi:hypothetical protein
MVYKNFFLKDIKWSFSKLNLYDTCKYAFYLQYIQEQKGINNAFANFGTCCHTVLENYENNKVKVSELVDEYKRLYPTIVDRPFPWNKYKDLNASYYEQGLQYFNDFEGFDDWEIIGIEKKVEFQIGEYKFGGYIDLVVRDKNKNIIIIDHKTKSKLTKAEKNKYLKQLYLYSIPLIEEYGCDPTYLKFNMIRFQDWITEEFSLEKLEETKQWANQTIEDILNEDEWLPKSDLYFCQNICSFRDGICQYIPSR